MARHVPCRPGRVDQPSINRAVTRARSARDLIDLDAPLVRRSSRSPYDNPWRRYQRTANKITSTGNGNQ